MVALVFNLFLSFRPFRTTVTISAAAASDAITPAAASDAITPAAAGVVSEVAIIHVVAEAVREVVAASADVTIHKAAKVPSASVLDSNEM